MIPPETAQVKGVLQQHGALIVRLGFVIDGTLILVSLCTALSLMDIDRHAQHLLIGMMAGPFFEIGASFSNFYRSWRVVRLRHELITTCVLWTVVFWLVVLSVMALHVMDPDDAVLRHPGEFLVAWYLAALGSVLISRIAVRMFLRYYRAFGHDHRQVAFIGTGQSAMDIAETFIRNPWMGIDVRGFYGDPTSDTAGAAVVKQSDGSIDDLVVAARLNQVSAIYIALSSDQEDQIRGLVDRFGDTTVPIYYCPSLRTVDLISGRWDQVGGRPVISVVELPFRGVDRQLKRLEDLILAALILPVALLPMLVIAISIKLTSSGPVIFRQTRHGLDGREFKIWKFRTMTVTESDKAFKQASRNDPRVTRLGAFLRSSSLDELPQLFNVISGEMSVVGPRPHPVKLNDDHRRVIPRYMLRHIVKPGITGWAQVNGFRGGTETADMMRARIEHDLYYIRNWSLMTDLHILIRTVQMLMTRNNAYQIGFTRTEIGYRPSIIV